MGKIDIFTIAVTLLIVSLLNQAGNIILYNGDWVSIASLFFDLIILIPLLFLRPGALSIAVITAGSALRILTGLIAAVSNIIFTASLMQKGISLFSSIFSNFAFLLFLSIILVMFIIQCLTGLKTAVSSKGPGRRKTAEK